MAAISGANIVNDGLILYLDPTNTNTYSGFGTTAYNLIPGGINNFSLVNGLAYDSDKSGSFYFDGSNDYVGLGSTTIFNSTAFTVSFWIKPTTYSGTYCSGAVSNGQYTLFGTTSSYQGYSSTFSGAIQTAINGNAIATVNQSNFSINKWYHYVAVYDSAGTGNSTKFKIYIDGTIKSLTFDVPMPSAPYAAGQESRIGWGPGGGAYPYYNGNIGLVQIHSKALSSTEILQNYNATKARFNTTENIVTDGLVYNLDTSNTSSYSGTGTTWVDLTGSGKNGTLTNGPTFSTLNSGTLVFDGSNDFINISATDLLTFGTNPFSIEFWMYSTYVYPGSGTLYKTILSNYSDYNGDFGSYFFLGLFNLNNSTLQNKVGVLDHTGNFLDFSFSVTVAPNQWTHITLTRNGSSFIWYKNGTLQVSASVASNNFSGVRTSKIGGGVLSVGSFTGSLPSLRIYNKTLSASEVFQNYNATKSRYINVLPPVSEGLILNLDAGNRASYSGTGTTWVDLSGNRLNGTLINGPTYSGTGVSTVITCDGTDDYIEVLDNSLLDFGANNFTVEYWFKKLATTTGYDNIWGVNKWNVGGGGAGTNEWALEIGQGSSGTGDFVAFAVESGSTTYATSYFNPTNALTQYHQLVGIRNGNKLELYLDGSQLYSNTPAGFTTSVSVNNISGRNLRIANAALNNLYTNTSSAVVRLYSKALSSTEVLQNFNFYRSRYGI